MARGYCVHVPVRTGTQTPLVAVVCGLHEPFAHIQPIDRLQQVHLLVGRRTDIVTIVPASEAGR